MPAYGASMNSPTPPVSRCNPSSPPCYSKPNSEVSGFAKQSSTASTHQPRLYLATLPTFTPAHDAGSSKSLQLGISRPKRKRITPEQLEVLSNLFEYTDTPTFDLREAIGSKLGMSNREVQVWFQNRRAKVNRQKIPSNSQVLHERPAPPGIAQQQDPSSASHRRMKSSPNLLLPGVSSILNRIPTSESCRSPYSSLPLLPPFQATLPGADNAQDGPMYHTTPDCYPSSTAPTSPQDPSCSEGFFTSSSQIRPSPTGTRRRLPISTPASLHSRKSPRCRSPMNTLEDPAGPLSPHRSSSDLPVGVTSDSFTPGLTTSRWSSASSHAPWSYVDSRSNPQHQTSYMSLGSMRLDHSQSDTTSPQDRSPTSKEPTNQPFERPLSHPPHHPLPHQSSASISIPTSRCFSESLRSSQQLRPWKCGGSAPAPTTLPLSRRVEHGRGATRVESAENTEPLAAPQTMWPGLVEDSVPTKTRSLFASRYLPPLPNPFRPGPGSFPPPPALRVVPIRKDTSPVARISESPHSSPHSISEFKLPPLLNEQNDR